MWTAVIIVGVVVLVLLEAADKMAMVKIRQRLDLLERHPPEQENRQEPSPLPHKRTAWD